MGEGKSRPLVLAVARSPEARRSLTRALTPELTVRELGFEALGDHASLLDAAAAVVQIGPADGPAALASAVATRSLPAGGSLVLLLDRASESFAEEALKALAPAQVLSAPVPGAVLRFAVRRAFASSDPGEGARPNQRRAPVLLGVSGAIREVLDQVKQVASARIPVLILGETGTGKELVARAIHEKSERGGPFVPVNCGALPDTLLESELFGYKKGAFTGASEDHHGLFAEANGGTLFLDEIGEMSPALQVKLLRVLETHEVRSVGDTHFVPVDVRLVSATNRDLEAAVEEGSFRRDLYYRINTVAIQVPPLRRRRVDIPFLAQHFAEEFGAAHARRITLDEDFIETLSRFEFPGNVRELRNAVERAIAMAVPDEPVTARHLVSANGAALAPSGGRANAGSATGSGTLKERVEQLEIEVIREALEAHDWKRTQAAEALGLSRQGLRYKMQRLGLED